MRALPLRGAAMTGVLALVLAACGSAKSGADSDLASLSPAGGVKCGLANGKKATGTTIKVGAIVTMSGGIDFSTSPKTAQAYFDCVNANGGINGRPIQYTMEDDALDPQKASALASKFAADPNIVAMAGGASFIACAGNQPIFEKANLYDILGVGVPKPCFYSKNMSALNAGPRLSLISAAQMQVKDFGIKSFASGGYTIPGLGDWVRDGAEQYAQSSGITLSYFGLVPPPITDATSVVTQLAEKKPDAMILGFTAPDNATYLKAAEQQGLADKVHFSSLTPSYDTTFPSQIGPTWNGKFYSNSEFALLNSTGADNLNWREVLKKYGSTDQPRDSFSQGGYLAARVLVEALLKLDPATINRATVSTAIQGIKGFKSDMLCTPWYFSGPGGHNNANHQLRNVKLDASGTYVSAAGCFETDDPALSDILAAEKSDPSLLGN
ncbi:MULTISPECIES: ABC transporter substrate-binding protein [unclassified Frankia]|uniref:ABC transporter substrate-binding protein n=1 Tax=unclassified Frankia TaxID=2632575 RepID=UPI002AD1E8E7|nr:MULTISPECIES: ABC transporter substrate-binding protein [unclassified Frankia]